MRGAAVALLVAATLFAACSGRRDRAERPERVSPMEACPTGEQTRTLDGREYILYIPKGVTPDEPAPLVINLHGFGSSARQQMDYTGASAAADRHRFVVAAPNGKGQPARFDADDVPFIEQLVAALTEEQCVDKTRAFSMGMSNGAVMSSILACRSPKTFRAVGLVAALVRPIACEQAPPIPVIAFMGTDDPIVPFAGGTVNCCGNPTLGAADEAMVEWSVHNRCTRATAERRTPEVEVRTWSECADGVATVFYVIHGGGHTWPGAADVERLGKTTDDVDATETIWEFFSNS